MGNDNLIISKPLIIFRLRIKSTNTKFELSNNKKIYENNNNIFLRKTKNNSV